jgi:hypothetical protein
MKKLILSFFIGFFTQILFAIITISMESWAPFVYRWLESILDFQLKPWIFFVPGVVALLLISIGFSKFRNMRALIALFAGCFFAILIGGAVIFVLAMASLPNMRY